MNISIITPSFNQGKYIRQTIESVLAQPGVAVEHWVIDGGSTDETLSVLSEYPSINWLSEPDNGQADALQKGLQRANGEIIGWINSDDYYEANCFKYVIDAFSDPAVGWVIGNLAYLYEATGLTVDSATAPTTHESLLRRPDIVRQQCTFFRRQMLLDVGGWDRRYHMTMDFDLWTRLARVSSPLLLNRRLAYFRMHADQKTSARNLMRQTSELSNIMQREGAPTIAIMQMKARKQTQLFKARLKEALIRAGLLSSRYASQPLRTR